MARRLRIEWIGVRSPMQDDRISYRKIAGLYSDKEEVLLEAVAGLIAPLIRQRGSTVRLKGPADGYSKPYKWGPWSFICEMDEIDVDRLFKNDPDAPEFRNLDDPDHDDRAPVVPWAYITKMLFRIMKEAENGPGMVLRGHHVAKSSRDAERLLDKWATDRIDEARDRGVALDPETLRIQR